MTDWEDIRSEPAPYGDPSAWRPGHRCPFCLASDGPYGPPNGPLTGCGVCNVMLLTEDEWEEMGSFTPGTNPAAPEHW